MIDTFLIELLGNLEQVGIAFIVFNFSVLANIVASCYYNTHSLNENFSLSRLIDGILKMLAIGISTGMLAAVASVLPYILEMVSIEIEDSIQEFYTSTAIIGLYANGIIKYYVEAYNTNKEIIENRDIIEDIIEDVSTEGEVVDA